jgi:hypothetical protein
VPHNVKVTLLCLALWLALPAASAHAADAGTVTIVEGRGRVLRDTTWYKLVPGARLREGDILVSTGPGQIQVELYAGGTFNLGGPGTLFAASVPMAGEKLTGAVDLSLPDGWLKLAAGAPATGFKVQVPPLTLLAADAIVVVHAQPGAAELFVESGAVKIAEAGAGGGKSAAANDLKAGEFAAQSGERPVRFDRRAPATFVAGIPRHLIDPLPVLAPKFKAAKVTLAAEQEVTYAEAEPWLAGPYRKTFLKRFEPRLKDHDFRAGVEAHIAHYPEWDRILHPEKYLPKVPAEAK